jgi:glycerol uptake facilitator-like aquaporin
MHLQLLSGGHINPAITLAMCILGRCKWALLPVYWAAQYVGAFMGSALLYGAYKGKNFCNRVAGFATDNIFSADAMDSFDGGVRQVYGPNATAGIFASASIK